MENFKFSESLRDKVIDALLDRMVDAMQSDEDTLRSTLEHGYPAIGDMDGVELMDEYMNWTGTYSIEEDPEDELLRKMIGEVNSAEFEIEVLDVKETIQPEENSTDASAQEAIS